MKYPKVKNYIKATVAKVLQNKPGGLISHPEDNRDHQAEELGLFMTEPKDTNLFDGLILNQSPWNTCVFFSRAQGASHQNGIHLSARWLVVVAYKNGWLSQDGFSTLEVGNKVGNKIGYVPEHECPSDTSKFNSFRDFATLQNDEYERLLKIAQKYQTKEYRRIHTENLAYQALETGHALFVGYKWTSNNNNPARYNYVLPFTGYIVGGHACELSGSKGILKMNPQTYGTSFGDNGIVWSRKFSDYGIYIEDVLSLDSRVEAFVKQFEGKMVKQKGDPACYVIQDGLKHHVQGDDQMKTFYKLNDDIGLKFVMKELLDSTPEGSPYPFIK